MSKNPLLQTLISMTGQSNVITIHRPFVEFTGSLEAAMMLSQLLYWTPKSSHDGWIAKSDKDWRQELCLTRYAHRKATETLVAMGIVETQVKKFNGSPTVHYLILWEVLENEWVSWLRSSENGRTENPKSDDGKSENERSLTETTTETTTDDRDSAAAQIFKALEELTGSLNSNTPKFVDAWLEKHEPARIVQAIEEAKERRARSVRYVDEILISWEANGYPKTREEKVKERRKQPTAPPKEDDGFMAELAAKRLRLQQEVGA